MGGGQSSGLDSLAHVGSKDTQGGFICFWTFNQLDLFQFTDGGYRKEHCGSGQHIVSHLGDIVGFTFGSVELLFCCLFWVMDLGLDTECLCQHMECLVS
jgi:hypothetical protein